MSSNHVYGSWRDVLVKLSVRGPRGCSRVGQVDREARLVIGLSGELEEESSEREIDEGNQDTLISWVDPAYQDSMSSWFNEHIGLDPVASTGVNIGRTASSTPEDHSAEADISVSFPIIHPETRRESWLCLTLLRLTPNSSTRTFSLVEVSSRWHQEQLAARAAGLIGLRHDLANQLFLFKALPELATFSSPEELMGDVTESASSLLEFIDARLSSVWISAQQPAAVTGAESIIETLERWVEQSALARDRWRLSFDDSLLVNDPLTLTCLGVQWSLSQLASLLKRSLVSGASTRAQILVRLMEYDSSRRTSQPLPERSRVGLCGQLAPREPRYALAISVEGWSPSEAVSAWRAGRGWSSDWSSLRAAQESPDEALAAWFGSWVSAAHQTRGIVELGEIRWSDTQPETRSHGESESTPALLICI